MKLQIQKPIAMLLSVCLMLGTLVPIPVFGATNPSVTISFTPEKLTQSESVQQVAMTVSVEPAASVGANYYITYDTELTYAGFESDTVKTDILKDNGGSIEVSVGAKSGSVTNLGTFCFDVPASRAGDEYEFEVRNIQVFYSTMYEVDPVSAVLEVSIGRTAAISGPASAFVGGTDDIVAYTINVTGDAYQSAELKLSYDTSLLEFDPNNNPETMSAANGVVTILEYGETKMPSYTVKFRTKGPGTATTMLTSAAFGTSATAVDGNLTAATITKASVNTVINKASFTVTLPTGVTGDDTVGYGQPYTFTLADTELSKYSYQVTATMGGQPVAVTENTDGTFTIANVTGDLVITVVTTPKIYDITFVSNTVGKLPDAAKVTYGQDYSFEMPSETGCTLAITEATIGGANYTYPAPVGGVVTIPGEAIVGDIVIRIERVSAAVTVTGSGAADASYNDTAVIGKSYTLTLNKDTSYNYTVTATMDGKPAALTNRDNEYTISTVTGPIVFTIQKAINIKAEVNSYITIEGSAVWLVKNRVNKLSDGVYTYDGTEMVWSEAYNAYCCLVISAAEPTVTDELLELTGGTADVVKSSTDVNKSGKLDTNDAQLVYDLYNGVYTDFSKVTMEKFLLADVNKDGMVNTNDAAAVISAILVK